MIRLSTIDNKVEFENGKLDLLSNVSKIDTSKIVMQNYVLVDDVIQMRPDILSLAVYGVVDKLDIILRFNNISNAFELLNGMVLALPTSESFEDSASSISIEQIKLQKQKILTSTDLLNKIRVSATNNQFTNTTNPAKKSNSSINYTKSNDGILKF